MRSSEDRLPVLKGGRDPVQVSSLLSYWQFAYIYAAVLIGKITANLEELVSIRDVDSIAPSYGAV